MSVVPDVIGQSPDDLPGLVRICMGLMDKRYFVREMNIIHI